MPHDWGLEYARQYATQQREAMVDRAQGYLQVAFPHPVVEKDNEHH